MVRLIDTPFPSVNPEGFFIPLANSPILPYTTHMTHEESKKNMTPKMKQFCKEYVIDFNGQRAYLASYDCKSKKSASVQASKLLKDPRISEYMEAYVQEQLGPLEKDLLGNVKFWIEMRDDSSASPSARLKASEHLAKYRSMFIEKKEIDVSGQVQIIDDIK